MKKTLYVLISFIFFFCMFNKVLADDEQFECEYGYKENTNNQTKQTQPYLNNFSIYIKPSIKQMEMAKAVYGFTTYAISSDLNKLYWEYGKGGCFEELYVCCTGYYCSSDQDDGNYTLYADNLQVQKALGSDDKCDVAVLTKGDKMVVNKSDSNEDGDDNDSSEEDDNKCLTYYLYYDKIKEKYEEYSSCKDNNCKISVLSEANSESNKLKTLCTMAEKNLNYDSPCLSKCLNLNEDILAAKKTSGISADKQSKDCTVLSDQIIGFIYNILKWIKYIIPALVIILNIMDFIKSIASLSDDAMKKAQSRFIKRLIVAAIIFLLPLVINFLLKTFGLYKQECDLGLFF